MATYVNDLRLKEIATGDESGTWGTSTNTNLELIGEALGFGTEAITTNADTHTTTVADGSTDPGRAMYIKYTGTLDSTCTITIAPNTMSRMHFIENGTSGSQDIIISQGSGANVTIPNGDVKAVYLDGAGSGAAVTDAFASLSVVDLTVQGAFTSQGIDDNADATAITINSSEQVGIGVTPVVTLDVGGTSDLVASFRSSTNNGNTSEAKIRAVDSDSSHVAIFQYQGYQHRFQDASGNEKVRIDNSGNVAIGHTTTTGSKLAICDGANSQIQFFPEISTDTNLTQHYDPTASAYINAETRAASHVWKIGTSEYMRVHTDGNVGIGIDNPATTLHLDASGGAVMRLQRTSANASNKLELSHDGTDGTITSTNDLILSATNVGIGTTSPDTTLEVTHNDAAGNRQGLVGDGATTGSALWTNWTTGNSYLDFRLGGTSSTYTKVRIDSSGNVGIDSGNLYVSGEGISLNNSGNQNGNYIANNGTSFSSRAAQNLQTHKTFYNPNGAVGTIQTNGSATLFNTSSDYRLKENVVTDWDATTLLKQLKPSKFNFIADADTTIQGFLAHEVSSIVPEAVSGAKDDVYTAQDEADGLGTEGQPKYQGIDQSKLVPLLVKTIQELEARIKTLEDA